MKEIGIKNGEEWLLAKSPVFKRRYTHDGDLILGCRYGCMFCYYRWIGVSRDYIGTGNLKRIATPVQMIQFLKNSKLFLKRDILILGARGDASMYPGEVIQFLELVKDDPYFKDNIFLALHRAPASEFMKNALEMYPNFMFGTTITPGAFEKGWTKIREDAQVKGIEELVDAGIDSSRISIEVGPLNSENFDCGVRILEKIQDLGFKDVMVRGVAFGTFGSVIDREKELKKMISIGFIERSLLEEQKEEHEYYVIKNFLDGDAKLQSMFDMRIHRHTYTYYSDVWRVPIAYNRNNKVRCRGGKMNWKESTVSDVVEKYGLKVKDVVAMKDHYFVELGEGTATEDIAMTVGSLLQSAVIFDNYHYHRTATLEDVAFYRKNGLFAL